MTDWTAASRVDVEGPLWAETDTAPAWPNVCILRIASTICLKCYGPISHSQTTRLQCRSAAFQDLGAELSEWLLSRTICHIANGRLGGALPAGRFGAAARPLEGSSSGSLPIVPATVSLEEVISHCGRKIKRGREKIPFGVKSFDRGSLLLHR